MALGWVSTHSEDLEIADGDSALRGLGGKEDERTVAGEAEMVSMGGNKRFIRLR